MSILRARLPRLLQGFGLVMVVVLAACSSASSSPTPAQGSPVADAPSVVPASIVPVTPVPTPAPTPVPVTPAPSICASSCVVIMVNRAYQPPTLNIKVGTEVTWSNKACEGGCTVTFPGISLESGPIAIGATFKHTFSEAGFFVFHCQLDENVMRGTIVVTD